MQYYIWTLENPGKATTILVAAALAAAIAAIAYRWYRKKHPVAPVSIKVEFDYRKSETTEAAGGCGREGCHCTVPCTNCTCHPATSKSKDDVKPEEGKCPFHRFF